MPDRPLIFKRLQVRSMPGFEDGGFELDELGPGVTIVTGPNEAGKTTSARAMLGVLWPSSVAEPNKTRLEASLDMDGEDWWVEYVTGTARFQRDGEDTDRPALPSAEMKSRHHLGLHDLLREEDEEFAAEIWAESLGGYDLEAIEDQLGLSDSIRTTGIGDYKAYQRAKKKIEEARKKQRELDRKRQNLGRLRDQLEEAEEAQRQAEFLEKAVGYRQKRNRLKELKEQREEFHPGCGKATGEEVTRMEALKEELGTLRSRFEEEREKAENAREELNELPFEEEDIDRETIEELEERAEKLEAADTRLEEVGEDSEAKRGESEEILDQLPDDSVGEGADLDVDGVGQIERFGQKVDGLFAKRQVLEEKKSWLEGDELDHRPEEVLSGIRELIEWLREASSGEGGKIPAWALALAIGLGLGAVLLGYAIGPIGAPLALLLGIALAVFGLYFGYLRRQEGANGTQDARRRFERADLPPPEAWTIEEVQDRLEELYGLYGELRLEEQKDSLRSGLEPEDRRLDEREGELRELRNELIEEFGVAPPVEDDYSRYTFFKTLLDYRKSQVEAKGLETKKDEIAGNVADHREEIESTLSELGYEMPEETPEVLARVNTVRKGFETLVRQSEKLSEAEDKKDTLVKEAHRKARRLASLFDELQVDLGDEKRVREINDSLDEYDDIVGKIGHLKDEVDAAKGEITSDERFESRFLETDLEELESELEALQEKGEEAPELVEKISGIEGRIDEREKGHQLEEALEERDRALEDLAETREENAESVLGQLLLDYVRERTYTENQPEVLERASANLVEFTRGRYELRVGGENGREFRAIATETGAGKGIDELSSGTRVQLLLAVRMGFVEAQEGGWKLPLFVDEALANTDDERLPRILSSLGDLAEQGRQIFYFTAQGDEREKIRKELERQGITYDERSLGDEADREPVTVDLEGEVEVGPETPPEPGSLSYREYGDELGIDGFDPARQEAGEAHLWYLAGDAETLHGLLSARITSWGRLRVFLEHGGSIDGVSDDALERIRARGELLEVLVRLYRRGRPSPISAEVLEEAPAVTSTMLPRVLREMEEVGRDPEQLIQALEDGRVDNFRSDKREELAEYFEEKGYMDTRRQLQPGELRAALSAEIEEEGHLAQEELDELLERLGF